MPTDPNWEWVDKVHPKMQDIKVYTCRLNCYKDLQHKGWTKPACQYEHFKIDPKCLGCLRVKEDKIYENLG